MLKALMLKRSLDGKRNELAELEKAAEQFATREAELEAAIAEVEPGNAEQEQAVNAEIEQFEADKAAHDEQVETLRAGIAALETELEELERSAPKPAAPAEPKTEPEKRGAIMQNTINLRSLPMNRRAFDALPTEQRGAIIAQPDVKDFLARVRDLRGQTRALTGAELSIPITFLELVAENMYRYSKLMNRVRVRNVTGEARQTIAGTIPEAVWTEMCGAINELSFGFNQITTDGYKVAGFIPVCNSLLEDNDINLASYIVEALSEAIGLAADKAILYGKGGASKMPLGIVTRLAQSSQPTDYPANAPAWVDLHESNIKKIGGDSVTGAQFWAQLMEATGATYTRYSRGNQFWAMNSKTYAKLKSKLISFTGTGDIVANLFGVLPIVNGDIDVLEFIPDGDIIGGYGDLYLLTQRSGMTIESSTEVQFIQDNTVFKGKQRMDGTPIIPGAFVAVNINNVEVTTTATFAADTANDADLDGITGLTLSPAFSADVTAYTATASAAANVTATPANANAAVALTYNGKNVVNGASVTPVTGTKDLVITVKNGNKTKVYTVAVTKS